MRPPRLLAVEVTMAAERPSKRACQDTFLFTSESVGEGHPGTCKPNKLERGGETEITAVLPYTT